MKLGIHVFIMLLTISAANASAWGQEKAYNDPNGNTHVVCLSDYTQSYELYIPPTAPATNRPILYAFDPGANGKSVLLTMAAAAAQNGWVVAASNNAHNGAWSEIFAAQDAIMQDTELRWNLHPTRRFAVGMSGGARASLALAFRYPEKICGVLCVAAGWPVNTDLQPGNDNLIVRILIGTLDSNYTSDIPETESKLIDAGVWCKVDPIEGLGHAWPSAAKVLEASQWLNQNAQKERNANYVPEECVDDSLSCQPPDSPTGPWNALASDDESWTVYEDFQGVDSPISRVDWWGMGSNFYCGYWHPALPFELFTISFHGDNSGVPGPAVYEEMVLVERTEINGYYLNNYPLYRFSAPLSHPVDLASGWVSIDSMANFLWLSSPTGNGKSLQYDIENSQYFIEDYDVAVSLRVDPLDISFTSTPDQGELPLEVNFYGEVEDVAGPVQWLWNFGDGSTSTEGPTTSHVYTVGGRYTVSLTVTSGDRSTTISHPNAVWCAQDLPAAGGYGLVALALALLVAAVARRRVTSA